MVALATPRQQGLSSSEQPFLVVLITTVFKVAPMLASLWVTLWPEWNTAASAVRNIYRLNLLPTHCAS